VLGGLLQQTTAASGGTFAVYEPNAAIAGNLRAALKQQADQFAGKVVRDPLTLQLLAKRSPPDVLFLAIDSPAACKPIHDALAASAEALEQTRKVILVPQRAADDDRIQWSKLLGFEPTAIVSCPYTPDLLLETMTRLTSGEPEGQEDSHPETAEAVAAISAELDMNLVAVEEIA